VFASTPDGTGGVGVPPARRDAARSAHGQRARAGALQGMARPRRRVAHGEAPAHGQARRLATALPGGERRGTRWTVRRAGVVTVRGAGASLSARPVVARPALHHRNFLHRWTAPRSVTRAGQDALDLASSLVGLVLLSPLFVLATLCGDAVVRHRCSDRELPPQSAAMRRGRSGEPAELASPRVSPTIGLGRIG